MPIFESTFQPKAEHIILYVLVTWSANHINHLSPGSEMVISGIRVAKHLYLLDHGYLKGWLAYQRKIFRHGLEQHNQRIVVLNHQFCTENPVLQNHLA